MSQDVNNRKRILYWMAQILGWSVLALFIAAWEWYNQLLSIEAVLMLVIQTVLGVLLSHLYRFLVLKSGWLELNFTEILMRMIFASVVFGIAMSFCYALILDLGFNDVAIIIKSPYDLLFAFTINWIFIFFLWSAVYLVYFYLQNYEREEIKNLRLEAAKNKMMLLNLRSQLNPHFMFNAINSIRALIDEDPTQAKNSLTQFSNLLRTTLLQSKKDYVTIEEELNIVKNFIDLQAIRYEERMTVFYDLEPCDMTIPVPLFSIQTLVENAVKHGISNRLEGGEIKVTLKNEDDHLNIKVYNTGEYTPGRISSDQNTGIGLANTRKRLALLYQGAASVKIYNENGYVVSNLILPKAQTHESINN